jgi:hypothetical protein
VTKGIRETKATREIKGIKEVREIRTIKGIRERSLTTKTKVRMEKMDIK